MPSRTVPLAEKSAQSGSATAPSRTVPREIAGFQVKVARGSDTCYQSACLASSKGVVSRLFQLDVLLFLKWLI